MSRSTLEVVDRENVNVLARQKPLCLGIRVSIAEYSVPIQNLAKYSKAEINELKNVEPAPFSEEPAKRIVLALLGEQCSFTYETLAEVALKAELRPD